MYDPVGKEGGKRMVLDSQSLGNLNVLGSGWI